MPSTQFLRLIRYYVECLRPALVGICFWFHYTCRFEAQMNEKVVSGGAYVSRSAGVKSHHPISHVQ